MISLFLQLMGFPKLKPVHSRASENSEGTHAKVPNGGIRTTATEDAGSSPEVTKSVHAQASPARRTDVKAKAGSPQMAAKVQVKSRTPVSVVKSAANSVVKVKFAASAKADPRASAKKGPAGAVKVLGKKVASTPVKSTAKPVAKRVGKATALATLKETRKSTVKPASKPGKASSKLLLLKKATSGPTPKASQNKPVKAVANATLKIENQKPASKVASKKVNVVEKKSNQPEVRPGLKAKAITQPVLAKSVIAKQSAVVPKAPAVAAPAAAPAASPAAVAVPVLTPKAGRPSSRLAQLTVPSMAQSVASTAAKSSYSQTVALPVIVPSLTQAAKKDPKLANNWKTKPVEQLTDPELLAMPDSEYMNDKQMAVFRLKLAVLKQDILNSAGETTEHLREDTVVVPDPADRATIEEEHALELRTRDRERKLLKKIEQSINRIDAGDYGYCDETGEPIGVGRLLARPTATLSLEAQQRRELKQKMFGD